MRVRRRVLVPLLAVPWLARAQAWPSQPVRLIAPFPPGGLVDQLARLVAPGLSARFGQPFVVENRPGAGGNVGAEAVSRAAPDGHTVLVGAIGPLALNAWLFPALPFDPVGGFAPVCVLAQTPKVLAVAPQREWPDVAAVVAAAKAAPGRLTGASAGNGTSLHLALAFFQARTGTEITHVPYRGAAAAVTDLLAGRVDLILDNVPNILPQLGAGGARPLATPSATRLPTLPAVPTMAEAGVPDFVFATWFGLAAPAGTPASIREQLAGAVHAILREPVPAARLAAQGAEPGGGTPEQFAALIAQTRADLGPVIQRMGIRAD